VVEKMRHTQHVLVLMLLALAVAGCRGKASDVDTVPEPAAEPERAAPAPAPPPREEMEPEPFPTERPTTADEPLRSASDALGTVYFAFDSSELTPQAISTLRENATWLKGNSDVAIVVEGHCDERGTIEYNIALGERRANVVRDYLGSLGVPRDRVRIVSYGEERPAEQGHGETAWSKNRRAEFAED
jgi:peptidoglycan-associated lipoprotein